MASLLAKLIIGEVQGEPGPSADMMADIIQQTLRPKLRITFLDGPKETIEITMEWANNRYMHGSTWKPGWFPDPTPQQRAQIGGAGGEKGAEWALEKIISDRYEMGDHGNVYTYETDDAAAVMGERYPGLGHRPFEWEMLNDHEPVEEARQPLTPEQELLRDVTRTALKPAVKITFLDGPNETIYLPLTWSRQAYCVGNSDHPGYFAEPTKAQMRQIGGVHLNSKAAISAAECAMERLHTARYEGDEKSGVFQPDAEDLADEAEFPETADDEFSMKFRPFQWEWINEPDPFGQDWERWERKEAKRQGAA